MAEPGASGLRPLVVGANHRSSSQALRDRLFVADAAAPGFLGRLKRQGVRQAIVLSTCDRVEVQAVHTEHGPAVAAIRAALAEHAGAAADALADETYVLADVDALRHILAVAASLDSLVVGEPHVLGQVKASHRLARDAGMIGAELEDVLGWVYAAAKRVRSETAIGERPVSLAAVAVELAQELHGDLERAAGIALGGGEMTTLVAERLLAAGLGSLVVLEATEARAEASARRLGCHVGLLAELPRRLEDADVVLSGIGGRRHLVTADAVEAALAKRRRRPIFVVDLAVPGDVEPGVLRIEDAFVYGLDDLERIALKGKAIREQEAEAAWRIVESEVDEFRRGRAERAAVPALTLLKRHFEAVGARSLADAGGDAERATRLVIGRLLNGPMNAMRRMATGDDRERREMAALEETIRRLFGLANGFGARADDEDGDR